MIWVGMTDGMMVVMKVGSLAVQRVEPRAGQRVKMLAVLMVAR